MFNGDKMDYIIRNENDEEIFDNDDNLKLSQVLRDNYRYIFESDGTLKSDVTSEELVFEGKVVGFASYLIDDISLILLSDVYVLPEFRGNRLFLENLLYMIASSKTLSIRQPTRNIVEILIHYHLAEKLTDSLVVCPIYLEILNKDIISKNESCMDDYMSNLYDLNLCSTLVLQDITTPGVCLIDYHKVLDDDNKRYDARHFRQSIDLDEYFEDIKKEFLANSDEFKDILFKLNGRLPSIEMDLKEIIGDEDELSGFLKKFVDKSLITIERAFEIKEQLKHEYENNIITSNGLDTRLAYLILGEDLSKDRDLFLENIAKTTMLCPCCYQPVSPISKSCQICGYNIKDNDLLDYDKVIEELKTSGESIIDLRGDDSNSQDDFILEILKEIYESGDEELFNEINEEYGLEIESINDLKDVTIENEVIIDYFGVQYKFIKNNTHPLRPIIQDERHQYSFFDDLKSDLRFPGLSHDLYACLSEIKENPLLYDFLYDMDLYLLPADIESILFGNNLIESKNYGSDFWDMVYNSYTVKEMKDALKKYHLKVSGNKKELLNRLRSYSVYKEFGEEEFIITDDGEEFLMNTAWISDYETCMSCFDFLDVETFMSNNRTKTAFEGFYKYLDKALEIAEEDENLDEILDIISSKSILLVNESRYKQALAEELKIFLLRINMKYLDENDCENFRPIIFSNIHNIDMLSVITNVNLKKEFKKAVKKLNLKKERVSKKIAFNYLKRAIDGEDMNVLSDNIVTTYFN